jgi:phosphoglycerol transferase MdoB-like AlkP superfamily enzyme
VWATITGTPDVAWTRTSTRIPRAVRQHTIVDDFEGYEKLYFLGGDATWANTRGLLKNNIRNLKLYEEADFKAKGVDVWGISDRDLFKESLEVMNKEKGPFFSIIQTASNHRPYTIPDNDAKEMGIKKLPFDTLHKYGYYVEKDEKLTNKEYNSVRYMDFCINEFIENAKKQPWYSNTIFLFVGDHGIMGNAKITAPDPYNAQTWLTCHHVPMLIYSPLLAPKQYDFICSQVDVLPTLAGLAGVKYTNTTLGRDLLKIAEDTSAKKFAFIITHDMSQIGILSDSRYYFKRVGDKKSNFVPFGNGSNNTPLSFYQRMTEGLFETSRYWIFNNWKKKPN